MLAAELRACYVPVHSPYAVRPASVSSMLRPAVRLRPCNPSEAMPAPAFTGKATVAGGAGKAARSGGRKQQQMPLCDYGAACTRKGCVYRHPPKPKRDASSDQRGASVAEELRYDGGELYPRSSFIEEYGEQGAAFWERAERPAAPERDAGSDAPVCTAFLAGFCTYGARCQGQHPPPDVAEAFRRKYASIPCQWGETAESERPLGCA